MDKRSRARLLAVLSLTGAAAASAGLAEGRWRLVTTEYPLEFPNLPEAFEGFRIVQFSDLHGWRFGDDNARLLRRVELARPDLIAVTGDLDDGSHSISHTEAVLAGLTRIAPVYFISGNHEWQSGRIVPMEELFRRYGVNYLRDGWTHVERGGERIVLAGVEDAECWYDHPSPPEVAAALPEGFRVLLGHRNSWIERYPGLPVDLILCGHAHGGIFRLPLVGGLLGHHYTLFPKHVDGVHRSGRYQMVVSRGLGNAYWVPRFCNPPELVVVELHKAP